jgi:hypothetical protein
MMSESELNFLKYPVGQYSMPGSISNNHINDWIRDIEMFPSIIGKISYELTDEQKNWRYRPGGWTVKQVVHHCADSHVNSLVRFKLTLTEERPAIKPYYENKWADLPDSLTDDLDDALSILRGIHKKWSFLLKNMTEDQYKKEFFHPEQDRYITLEETLGLYSWHCRHHLAHIQQAIKAGGKYNSK